jgi:hypothetical protein
VHNVIFFVIVNIINHQIFFILLYKMTKDTFASSDWAQMNNPTDGENASSHLQKVTAASYEIAKGLEGGKKKKAAPKKAAPKKAVPKKAAPKKKTAAKKKVASKK